MNKRQIFFLMFVLLAQISSSCSKDDDLAVENQVIVIPVQADGEPKDGNGDDSTDDENPDSEAIEVKNILGNFYVTQYANNGRSHQSAAAYGDYAFFVTDKRSALYCYNLKTKRVVCAKRFEAVTERTSGNYILYHCNQMTFGPDFYDANDPFPLLYISQRARSDRRCIVEVYRLLPQWSEGESEYISLDAELVQMIYFPVETVENSLGRVNCVMDCSNRVMYAYSYSTISGDPERSKCRITGFTIPDMHEKEVILNDNDIVESYKLGYTATNSQGGCIKDGKLYIVQGFASFGIFMNVFDLSTKRLLTRVDLLANGITWEPEGCFVFQDAIMVSTGKDIWEFKFANEE